MSQLMPLPLTVSCFSKIQIGFTFLVPAHLDSLGKRAVKRVCGVHSGCVTGENLNDVSTNLCRSSYRKGCCIACSSGLHTVRLRYFATVAEILNS